MPKPLPPVDYIRARVAYDSESGEMVNRINRCNTARLGASAYSQARSGYMTVQFRKKNYLAHRVIWLLMTGEDPATLSIDHVDGDPSNNRWSNLRMATHLQNMKNMKRSKANTSGYKGVSLDKRRNLWRAMLRINGKYKFLGYAGTAEGAASLYRSAVFTHNGEFARIG